MRDASLDLDAVRVFVHVVAMSVWLGGQIVLGALVPLVRREQPAALSAIAKAFGRIGWPFFGLAVFTGVWNMLAVDSDDVTSGWNAVLGIKMLLVVVSGVGAWIHQTTSKPAIRGATAGIGLLAALAAALLGTMLAA